MRQTRKIHHIARPIYGSTNDITITYNDTYPREAHEICIDLIIVMAALNF